MLILANLKLNIKIFRPKTQLHSCGNSKNDVENYRPVSLLNCVSKVFERCIYLSFYEFLRPKLTPCQYGFRQRRSCTTQLLHFLDDVYKGLADGKKVEIAYTNFEKLSIKSTMGCFCPNYSISVSGESC